MRGAGAAAQAAALCQSRLSCRTGSAWRSGSLLPRPAALQTRRGRQRPRLVGSPGMRAKGRALLRRARPLAGTRCRGGFGDRFLARLLGGTMASVLPTPRGATRGALPASGALAVSPCRPLPTTLPLLSGYSETGAPSHPCGFPRDHLRGVTAGCCCPRAGLPRVSPHEAAPSSRRSGGRSDEGGRSGVDCGSPLAWWQGGTERARPGCARLLLLAGDGWPCATTAYKHPCLSQKT